MAMPKISHGLLTRYCTRSGELDGVLDLWIRDALREEALAQPSPGAWERLRSMLERRPPKRYGMWVLDEVLRDPPESLPTTLSQEQYQRAKRLHAGRQQYQGWRISNLTLSHPMHLFPMLFSS